MHHLVLELVYASASGELPDCDGVLMVVGTFFLSKAVKQF
jgi:hypothetical protein